MAGKGGTSGFKYSFLTDKVYVLKLVRRGIVSKGWTCIPLVAGPGLGRGEKEKRIKERREEEQKEEEGGRRKQREEARR